MGRTKKVGPAGRYGPRYGLKIRKAVAAIEKIQRKPARCPRCGYTKVKRISTGIYKCKKCGAVFAGGAYIIETITGAEVRRALETKGGSSHGHHHDGSRGMQIAVGERGW